MANTNKLRLTLVRSTIARDGKQLRIVKALGFHRLHETVEHANTPQIRGMVKKVIHLVKVEEV
ncbi:50S ribosomal protein L30 [bacterium]|nr:50S ribosomal protein L30 [bacterium]